MPELLTMVYNKFIAGDLKGSVEARLKPNPVRRTMREAGLI